MNLLVVEDDPLEFELIIHEIQKLDPEGHFACRRACSELEFVEWARNPDREPVAGIIMDVMLSRTTTERWQDIESGFPPPHEAGFRNCRLMAELGWTPPLLLCSNLDRLDLLDELERLPEFAGFCTKIQLRSRLPQFLDKVRSLESRRTSIP